MIMDEKIEKKYEHLETLASIAEDLSIHPKKLQRWAEPSRSIGFPEAKQHLGRYLLYDKREVIEWCFLWSKINKNLGNKGLKRRSNG